MNCRDNFKFLCTLSSKVSNLTYQPKPAWNVVNLFNIAKNGRMSGARFGSAPLAVSPSSNPNLSLNLQKISTCPSRYPKNYNLDLIVIQLD